MFNVTAFVRNSREKRHGGHNDCRGVTLVELLVAAVILVLGIISLLAVIGVMQRERSVDYHRRQARIIINRIFETSFIREKFPGSYKLSDSLISPEAPTNPNRNIDIMVDRSPTLSDQTFNTGTGDADLDSVIIDNSGDRRFVNKRRLKGTISARFQFEDVSVEGISVETHQLTLKIKWTEFGEAQPDSVVLIKRLAKAVQQ